LPAAATRIENYSLLGKTAHLSSTMMMMQTTLITTPPRMMKTSMIMMIKTPMTTIHQQTNIMMAMRNALLTIWIYPLQEWWKTTK
jgi:transcription termination factor Rho